jgi:hypothetical protein
VATLNQIASDKTLAITFQHAVDMKRAGLAENEESTATYLANSAAYVARNSGPSGSFTGVSTEYAQGLVESASGPSLSPADLPRNMRAPVQEPAGHGI